MPQRSLNIQVVEPISLRRSPRFLQFKDSPTTPKPRSRNPNYESTISWKCSKVQKKFDNGSTICGNPSNGSKNCGKLSNGSKNSGKSSNVSGKTTKSNCNAKEIEGLRRSPRFCNEVNSSIDLFVSLNRMFDRSINCNSKSNKGSKNEFVDCPVTPIGVGEKKFMGVTGKGSETETSGSWGEIAVNSERRITRSCSRLLGRKVEVGMISQSKQEGRNLFNNQGSESKARRVLGPVQPSAVGLGGGVKTEVKSCGRGKENRSGSCKGSKTIRSISLSRCVNRGGQGGRRNNLVDDDHGKEGKTDESRKKTDESLERRITRSVSKQMGGENDSNCQTMVRRSPRMSSTHVARKTESIEARKKKQEGSDSFIGTEPLKTIQCGSMLSACVVEDEKKGSKDIKAKEKESDDCAELDVPGRRETKLTGVKRRRKQDGLQGNFQGWTKEQEVALHKAYFTAKPSLHFWKKVAKLVPGKSAQECFDKVHSDNQTPLCSKPSSRAKKQNSPSDILVSGSELFKSVEMKSKRPCKKKCKSHVARKTVRQLLQKYFHVNQDNEADLFAVLEPSVNNSAEALQLNAVQLTPEQLLRSPDSSSKSRERSSSGRKKHLSRFSDRSASPLTSPPVLKKVKNMALHEKYIDQLHIRENKRTVAFSRCMKSARNQMDRKENSVHMKDIFKAAKDALVLDAKDAIDKFQQSQANIMEGYSDSEEFLYSDNDEDETVL